MPQNAVYSIAQTPDGYLWFTTLDGLVRYDGVRFTVFNKSNTEAIISNRFSKMLVDSQGALWAGTEGGHILRMHEGKFTRIPIGEENIFDEFSSFLQDPDGSVLIITHNAVLRWRNGTLTRDASTEMGSRYMKLHFGRSGARWSLDKTGRLEQVKEGSSRAWNVPGFIDVSYVLIYEDSRGDLWLGLSEVGLCRFKDGDFRIFTEKDGMPLKFFRTITEDREGNIWIGGSTGLARYRDGVFTNFTKEQGLSSNYIRSLFVDREGTLWIGTHERGINRANRQAVSMLSTAQGVVTTNAYEILEDRAGNIWIGSFAGLTRIGSDNRASLINPDGTGALCEDREGNIWFSIEGRVFRYKDDVATNISKTFPFPPGSYRLQAIYQDRSGAIWFGTGIGLVRLKEGQYRVFRKEEGLPGLGVTAILEDAQDNLWAATTSGLARFDGERFTGLTTDDGLPSNHIRSLYIDGEGVLWIGTYDGGLARFKGGRIAAITMKDGLFSNGVFQILEDDAGFFWMSSNRGIYRASRQQLNDFADGRIKAVICTTFGKADGMLNAECNGGRQPAGIKTRDGRLLFPTQEGVAIIDPRGVPFNLMAPPILIEECVIDRQPTALQGALELAPGQIYLDIHYTALSFIKPEQVQFKYKLEGLDSDWIEAGARRTAYYSHLPPGRYTFRVIAANSDGVWNMEGASIEIIVVPPFYRTWWFQSLAALIVAGAVFYVYRWRLLRLKRAHAAQEEFSRRLIESQEGERKRIAAELHDSLGQSLAIIKNRALFGINAPINEDQAKVQFDQIASHSTQAIDEVKEIAYNLRPYLLDRLGLRKAIESMLNKVAASSGISISSEIDEIDDLIAKQQEINLYRIVQEGINNVVKHSEASEASVRIVKDTTSLELTIRDNGKGFAPEATEVAESRRGGFGLIGINERARILGGKPVIDSAPGRGTTIRLRLPIKDGQKGDGR